MSSQSAKKPWGRALKHWLQSARQWQTIANWSKRTQEAPTQVLRSLYRRCRPASQNPDKHRMRSLPLESRWRSSGVFTVNTQCISVHFSQVHWTFSENVFKEWEGRRKRPVWGTRLIRCVTDFLVFSKLVRTYLFCILHIVLQFVA